MQHLTRVVETFPTVSVPHANGGLPVEVSLIAQLGHGAGNHLYSHVASRQKGHAAFIDAMSEPSAKLAGTHFALGDTTSLYSFVVGPQGHPFHRHAGHRIFTAVSGSGGAQLRFSTATPEEIRINPLRFMEALHFINIPPDCMFSVRFGGETWHQFWPLSKNSLHPVFFALSCHTDELGGNLPDEMKERIKANEADIPTLTELLPAEVAQLVHSQSFQQAIIPTTTLSLDAAAGTMHRKVCDTFRGSMGLLRGAWGAWRGAGGYVSQSDATSSVIERDGIPEKSILHRHLDQAPVHHEDCFELTVNKAEFGQLSASRILELLLEGFLSNAPRGVSRLMLIRNVLVSPLGLRTSPLGCPVSSLLSDDRSNLFANQFPVLDQQIDPNGALAQVVLGANDKHLMFRSCIGVETLGSSSAKITMATRVSCKNLFGRFYMAAINLVHRRYIAPTMLRRASDYVVSRVS